MSTRLYFVRHGDTDWIGTGLPGRMPDVHLSELGKEQIERLPSHFKEIPVEAVYSSPMERTLETATPLAERLGVELITNEDLLEMDFGLWSGRTFEDLESDEHWRMFNTHRIGTRAPGGELMVEVQARMVRAAEEARQKHRSGEVVLVSHGDPIRCVFMHYLGMPLDFYQRFEIEPASVSLLELDDWGAKVGYLNRTGGG